MTDGSSKGVHPLRPDLLRSINSIARKSHREMEETTPRVGRFRCSLTAKSLDAHRPFELSRYVLLVEPANRFSVPTKDIYARAMPRGVPCPRVERNRDGRHCESMHYEATPSDGSTSGTLRRDGAIPPQIEVCLHRWRYASIGGEERRRKGRKGRGGKEKGERSEKEQGRRGAFLLV